MSNYNMNNLLKGAFLGATAIILATNITQETYSKYLVWQMKDNCKQTQLQLHEKAVCYTTAHMKKGISIINLITSILGVFAAVQKVQAATLDLETKRLELQAIQENGESIKVTRYLTEKELEKIIQTEGKLEIQLGNGKEVVIQVVDKTSSNLTSVG